MNVYLSPKWSRSSYNLVGVFFGLIFSSMGAFFFYNLVILGVIERVDLQSWQSVPAQLNDASVESYYQSDESDGNGTTMYQVNISYSYNYMGQSYTGTRVSLSTFRSSERSDQYNQLSDIRRKARNNDFRVWVNPENPSQAVYDRSLNLRMTIVLSLFTGTFIIIGIGIIVGTRKEEDELATAVPGQPWTSSSRWNSPVIYSDANSNLNLARFLTILSISFFGAFVAIMVGQGTALNLMALVFSIPPLLLFRWYWKKRKEWRYYRKVPLELSSYPVSIGGELKGSIVVPEPLRLRDRYSIELRCTLYRTKQGVSDDQLETIDIWSKKIKPTAKPFEGGTRLEFECYIPADQPESSKHSHSYFVWTVEVDSDLESTNFQRNYEVPVFKTEASQTVEQELQANPLSQSEVKSVERRVSSKEQGRMLSFHTPRDKAARLVFLIGVLFFPVGIFIYLYSGSWVGIGFSGIACIAIVLGLLAWGKNCRVRVFSGRIDVDVYIFSRLWKQHKLHSHDVRTIETKVTSTRYKQKQLVSKEYGLVLNTKQHGYLNMGGAFSSAKEAAFMKRRIEDKLFGSSSS